jgi:hypothetical protein
LPPITTAPLPRPDRASQRSTSVTRTLSARSICASIRSGSLEATRRNSLRVSLRPAAGSRRRGRQAAIRHQRRHVRSGPQACGALCGTGAGARACKPHLGLWQFSHEAEWGLLCIGDRAAVAETRAFLKQRTRADLATQSGPMLVINGRVHPRFDERSTSLKARNGVGVRADGKVIFAISQGEVTFDAFARLFRDGLNCPNALFLDGGSASSLYAPSLNRVGNILSLGPMLAVYERNRGASRQRGAF